ncbi:MAG: hypothetical protein LR001_00040 [Clostridiales bacterium]|nr:hypothetical protein [Clostridiales bacterium]
MSKIAGCDTYCFIPHVFIAIVGNENIIRPLQPACALPVDAAHEDRRVGKTDVLGRGQPELPLWRVLLKHVKAENHLLLQVVVVHYNLNIRSEYKHATYYSIW